MTKCDRIVWPGFQGLLRNLRRRHCEDAEGGRGNLNSLSDLEYEITAARKVHDSDDETRRKAQETGLPVMPSAVEA